MVVIAIIVILVAILFPVFARARENARRASCQSNLKQIMLGMAQYTQDYDETYVPYSITGGSFAAAIPWTMAMDPYIKSRQLYVCPSNSEKNVTYTLSIELIRASRGASGPRHIASVPLPAQTPAFLEANGTVYTPPSTHPHAQQALVFIPNNTKIAGRKFNDPTNFGGGYGFSEDGHPKVDNHFNGGNYAYADGHVKFLRMGPLVSHHYAAVEGLDYDCDGTVGPGHKWG